MTVTGSVKITRKDNQVDGGYAVVNLNTGISRIFPAAAGLAAGRANQRVKGLFVPQKKGRWRRRRKRQPRRPLRRAAIHRPDRNDDGARSCRHYRQVDASFASGGDTHGLVATNIGKRVQASSGAARRLGARPKGRGGRSSRPQRRRQDDLFLLHHRPDQSRYRAHPA